MIDFLHAPAELDVADQDTEVIALLVKAAVQTVYQQMIATYLLQSYESIA